MMIDRQDKLESENDHLRAEVQDLKKLLTEVSAKVENMSPKQPAIAYTSAGRIKNLPSGGYIYH